ncbi:uncharacterized protein CCR75_009353 [Bremia lactucae]|uniref:Uncharacterized protein n=1 Tax=Bremia lactucae TaxID=4779 RepID=A0A976IKZ3_BRELC|nr:hypothetical protein CCR75_009353 [Bremia lactucae]
MYHGDRNIIIDVAYSNRVRSKFLSSNKTKQRLAFCDAMVAGKRFIQLHGLEMPALESMTIDYRGHLTNRGDP